MNPRAYWKGKHLSEEHRRHMRGKKFSRDSAAKRSGERHWNWRGGVTLLAERIRKNFKYRLWLSDVFHRDDFTCQDCNRRGVRLEAHHIKSFAFILELNDVKTIEQAMDCEELWDINNGITLCEDCHIKRHKKLKLWDVFEAEVEFQGKI